jgi:hypothetical protein
MPQAFGMSPRACDDYLRRVSAEWAAERAEARPTEREQTIARLTRLARTLEKRGAWGPLVALERLLAEVRGVRAPARGDVAAEVKAEVKQAEPIQAGLERLTDAELETLEALLCKVEGRNPPSSPAPPAPS